MITNRCLCPKTLKVFKQFKIAWKNTKPLVLHCKSTFLSTKNDLKIFLSTKACEKGGPALKWSLLEHVTL